MIYRLSLFFYTKKQRERKIDYGKIFCVWYRAAGAGTANDARTKFYSQKKWGDCCEEGGNIERASEL